MYNHKAESAKIQSEIENLNQIIASDYNVELFERNAEEIKVKCELLLERLKKKSIYNVLRSRKILKVVLAAAAGVSCFLLGSFKNSILELNVNFSNEEIIFIIEKLEKLRKECVNIISLTA